MAVGIEYLVNLDAFSMGWFSAFFLFLFLYIFTYLALRSFEEKPWDKALWIACATFVAALFLAFVSIPSIWCGVIIVVVYALVYKHETHQSRHEGITSFISLWVMLTIFSFLPDAWRLVLVVFALIYCYLLSEIDIRKKKKEKEKGKEKK